MQQPPHPLYGITISTNYADLLHIILPQNQKFFTKWYIVTAETDATTIETIRSANYAHIEILYFDFKKEGAKFNKGGAIRFAQETVIANHGEGVNTLILDSDIYLHDEFGVYYSENSNKIEPNKLYGVEQRLNYSKYSDFKKQTNGTYYRMSKGFVGFFQLYKQTANKLYIDSKNCGECDEKFIDLFTIRSVKYLYSFCKDPKFFDDVAKYYFPANNCVYIPITVSHLGDTRPNGLGDENWNGRMDTDDFILDDVLA